MTSSRFISACSFAVLRHKDQKRKAANRTTIPYVVHPLAVAQILCEIGINDEDVLIAAVLHDTLEDTKTTPEELRFKFGDRVLGIVQECTDDPTLDREAQRLMQVKSAPHKSYPAKLVKCADKTDNMRDLVRCPPGWETWKIRKYAEQGRAVVQALNSANELPQALISAFWNASQEVFDWCDEMDVRAAKETVKES
jgi:(p)ppGpp synthase/HD superfamily hydrolase